MKAAQPGADQSPVTANSWLRREDLDAVPMLDLERRVRRVRRRASGILALVVVLAVALAVDAHAVIRDPALAIAPAAVLLCLAALATPLMRVGLRHGGDDTIDELTGMLTRNALSLRVRELTAQSRMTAELRLRTEGLDWRAVEGRIVALLPGDRGEIVVNRTGTVLWRLLAEGADPGRLRDQLVESFGIDRVAAERDVAAFLAELRRRRLLEG